MEGAEAALSAIPAERAWLGKQLAPHRNRWGELPHEVTMKRLLGIALLFTASLASQTPAPPIRSLLQPAPAASLCLDRATHVFRCAQVRMRSAAVDLTQFEGQVVEVEGDFVAVSRDCRILDVRSVHRAPQTLLTTATNFLIAVGQPLGFAMHGVPHDAWLQLAAGGNALIETPFGALLLEARTLIVFDSGTFDANGFAASRLQVPVDPSLVGADFHWQNLTASAIRREINLSNSDCVTVTR